MNITISDLHFTYPTGVEALRGVSLVIAAGEAVAILGENGAGKTTLVKHLNGLLRPTRGTATINGYDIVTQPSQVRRQIGFVSANTAVYDRMTAWEMVEHFGRLYGIAEEELKERLVTATGWRRAESKALLTTLAATSRSRPAISRRGQLKR